MSPGPGCGRHGAAHPGQAVGQRGDTDVAVTFLGGQATLCAASGSATRTAASTALMIRRLDQHRQFTIRAASDSSSWEMILLSMTSSVRMMINSTVRQSVQPSASNAAILGSRVSSVSACENMKLAARADRFIAAATSAAVR